MRLNGGPFSKENGPIVLGVRINDAFVISKIDV
jgi:hypothetical protein